MNVLVTGGAGFLGSHLCDALVEGGHDVWCLDNFVTSDITNVTSHVHLIVDNVDGQADLPVVDWLFHLASPTAPEDIQKFYGTCMSANIDGTKRLINHVRECGGKLLFMSSMKVYGDCQRVQEYISSKRIGETMCTDHKIARLANAYGPRMREKDSRVIPTFITRALRDEPLSLWNGGRQLDSFCYVSDIIRGLIKFMESELTGVIELGSHIPTSIFELATEILHMTNSKSQLRYDEEVTVAQECHTLANLDRAMNELGWVPEVTLFNGLSKTIKYFEERANVGKVD